MLFVFSSYYEFLSLFEICPFFFLRIWIRNKILVCYCLAQTGLHCPLGIFLPYRNPEDVPQETQTQSAHEVTRRHTEKCDVPSHHLWPHCFPLLHWAGEMRRLGAGLRKGLGVGRWMMMRLTKSVLQRLPCWHYHCLMQTLWLYRWTTELREGHFLAFPQNCFERFQILYQMEPQVAWSQLSHLKKIWEEKNLSKKTCLT